MVISHAPPSPGQLVRKLIGHFGDADAIASMLSADAEWWISPSVGVLGSPTAGRRAILDSLTVIFTDMYADMTTEIHHVLDAPGLAACRFTVRARALFADGRPYENEYSLWIQTEGDEVTRVWEYLDVAHAMGQFDPGKGLP